MLRDRSDNSCTLNVLYVTYSSGEQSMAVDESSSQPKPAKKETEASKSTTAASTSQQQQPAVKLDAAQLESLRQVLSGIDPNHTVERPGKQTRCFY